MKKYFFLLLLSFSFAYGQEDTKDSLSYNLMKASASMERESFEIMYPVTPSPNAASLGMYGSHPVGHYNGLPEITVPLYEINLDGKTFPISLAYHASGIKVDQEASWVGLGWSLQTGGTIVKEVRGWDDFGGYGPASGPSGYHMELGFPQYINHETNDWDHLHPNILDEREFYQDYSNGILDPEPDLFHFNFANYQGSMFFKKINQYPRDEHPKAIQLKNTFYMDATYENSGSKWTIYDGEGYCYYFGTHEITESYVNNYNHKTSKVNRSEIKIKEKQPRVISCWHLDSIVSPKGNSIKFDYVEEEIYTQISFSESVYILRNMKPGKQTGSSYPPSPGTYMDDYNYSYSKIKQQLLNKITFNGGEITFQTSDREDIESTNANKKAQKLEEIKIKNYSGNTMKNIKFHYHYNGNEITTKKFDSWRLMLDKIDEYVNNQEETKTHEFKYNTGKLPLKTSHSTDLWGYYNGSVINPSNRLLSLPSVLVKIGDGIVGLPNDKRCNFYPGKSGTPDDNKMQYGILTQIKYPTKGVTTFTYEPHRFEIREDDPGIYDTHYLAKEIRGEVSAGFSMDDIENKRIEAIGNNYTINKQNKKFYIEIGVDWRPENTPQETTAYVILEKLNNGSYQSVKETIFGIQEETSQLSFPLFDLPSNGTYRIRLLKEAGEVPCYISAMLNSYLPDPITYGGGLRIKEITTKDVENGKILQSKKYRYEKNGVTSGKIMFFPQIFMDIRIHDYPIPDHEWILDYVRCGLDYVPFSNSANGSPVGYSYVEEITGDNEEYGKTTYEYQNIPDVFPIEDRPMPGYPTIKAVGNGDLLKQTFYDAQNRCVKQIENRYTYVSDKLIKGVKIHYHAGGVRFGVIHIKFYDLFLQFSRLSCTQTTDYIYDNDTQRSSIHHICYGYHPTNYLRNRTTLYDKNTDIVKEITYKYPSDFSNNIYKNMVDKHMVNLPVEIREARGNELNIVAASKQSYKDTLNMFLPHCVYSLKSSSPLTENKYQSYYQWEGEYKRYTSNGKPLEILTRDNINTVYLWGYKGLHPIAEIKNATYQEVQDNLGIDIETLSKQSTPNMTYIENLRNHLPHAFITTYKYNPMIGITEIKDPRQVTTRYNYEDQNRLKDIRLVDNGLNVILQSFKYNFRE